MHKLDDGRGVLYPDQLPTRFRRIKPPVELQHAVRWFWIVQWNLPDGQVSEQKILPFPASNLVVEPHEVALYGPTTMMSIRHLTGQGFAVGALLRPAAMLGFSPAHNSKATIEAPDLLIAVRQALRSSDAEAVGIYANWLCANLMDTDEAGLQANVMEDLIATNRSITKVQHLAQQLHCSERSLQRLAKRYVGVSPVKMIRRYRLQEAAYQLRIDSEKTIGDVAFELGYADQAHLNADFREILGISPKQYQQGA